MCRGRISSVGTSVLADTPWTFAPRRRRGATRGANRKLGQPFASRHPGRYLWRPRCSLSCANRPIVQFRRASKSGRAKLKWHKLVNAAAPGCRWRRSSEGMVGRPATPIRTATTAFRLRTPPESLTCAEASMISKHREASEPAQPVDAQCLPSEGSAH